MGDSDLVSCRRFSTSLSNELYEALHRLRRASGTPISKLLDEFLNVEVLNSISESLEMVKQGRDLVEVKSHMSSVVGRHVIAASETLKDLRNLGGDK